MFCKLSMFLVFFHVALLSKFLDNTWTYSIWCNTAAQRSWRILVHGFQAIVYHLQDFKDPLFSHYQSKHIFTGAPSPLHFSLGFLVTKKFFLGESITRFNTNTVWPGICFYLSTKVLILYLCSLAKLNQHRTLISFCGLYSEL